MSYYRILILLFIILIPAISLGDSIPTGVDYNFILQDRPSQLFTMRQFNQNYLSGYRLFARGLNHVSKNEKLSIYIQIGLQALFLMPLSHEEGHRSILTAKNIGAISQPYFNKHGAAYVKGVSNQTLRNLRDNDLPNYIRLHTAGLESDYMLTKRMENIASFKQDKFENYKWEYCMRKLVILQYYLSGLFKMEINLTEETNELERDIVGHDVYGATRHLFRPTMNFYRYTNYRDLSREEKTFVGKVGFRSLLNLGNPLLFGKENFKWNQKTSYNIGLGHALSPFGDFIDETVWIKHEKINLSVYARQFQNKLRWFHGFGATLDAFPVTRKLYLSLSGHFWQQAKDLAFSTSKSFVGGALDMDLKYLLLNKSGDWFKGFSIGLGLIYKTKGFLPEEVSLDENIGFRIGISFQI